MHGNQVFYKCWWSSEGNIWNKNSIKFCWRLREAAVPWLLTRGTSHTFGLAGPFPPSCLGPPWCSHRFHLHVTEDVSHCPIDGGSSDHLHFYSSLTDVTPTKPFLHLLHICPGDGSCCQYEILTNQLNFVSILPQYMSNFPHSPWQLVSLEYVVTIAAISRIWGGG